METITRFKVGTVNVSAVSLQQTIQWLKAYDTNTPGYICLPDTYVIARADSNLPLRHVLNNSTLTLPDGKPLQIIANLEGFKHVTTVSGYKLILAMLQTQKTHVFWGASPQVLGLIKHRIESEYPQARVLGYFSPPLVAEDAIESRPELHMQAGQIAALKPDIVWVGISSPKQDFLMQAYHTQTRGLMVGVGGVFDYLAGTRKISPEWVKKIGMRWLWRLVQDPKRLGSKYWLTAKTLTKYMLARLFA